MADDPYRVLGVAPDASDGEIKRAYRKLARQYHPDRNPGDAAAEERFKAIQAAYEQVESPQKRREYDEQQRMQSMFGGGDLGNIEFNFEGGAPGRNRGHHRLVLRRPWLTRTPWKRGWRRHLRPAWPGEGRLKPTQRKVGRQRQGDRGTPRFDP